uniref:Thy-1 cell surface antigen n=1 Tax=Gasterosteus aculeatus aculeatus TaxID=481459 RepID=G3QAT6_GASAC
MELHLFATALNSVTTFLFAPRGPQMFPCLTYLEHNVRVDCEFPPTYQVPGPYCEYRQDSRLVGSTYPNAVVYVSTEDRRRSNVSLVAPNLCRLTWAPLADEKPFTYTCRVYQGSSWKENSMAVHHSEFKLCSVAGILPICSAISVLFESTPWFLSLVMSLPMAVGLKCRWTV